jgi:hypothetical protein
MPAGGGRLLLHNGDPLPTDRPSAEYCFAKCLPPLIRQRMSVPSTMQTGLHIDSLLNSGSYEILILVAVAAPPVAQQNQGSRE